MEDCVRHGQRRRLRDLHATRDQEKVARIKMDMKWRAAAHCQSVARNGRWERRLTSFEGRVAALIGTMSISEVVAAHMGDSDQPQSSCLIHNCIVPMVQTINT